MATGTGAVALVGRQGACVYLLGVSREYENISIDIYVYIYIYRVLGL